MLIDLFYDEFDGTELDAAWKERYVAGQAVTTLTVINGKLRVTMPAGDPTGLGCYLWLEQPKDPEDLVRLPNDVYCKFTIPGTLPGAPAWGYGIRMFIWDEDEEGSYEGDLAIELNWNNVTGPYQWSAFGWSDWDEYDEYAESISIPAGNPTACWFRIRSVPGKIGKVYYSLTEPEYDTDWTEVTFGSGYIKPNTASGLFGFLVSGDCENLAVDTSFYLDFVRSWVGKRPSARCRSRQIDFNRNAPTSVEEMKDGEMRVIGEDLYARVGDQVLLKNLVAHLPTTTTTTTTT